MTTAPRLALFFALLAGCTLDWTVRPDPALPVEAGTRDAATGADDDDAGDAAPPHEDAEAAAPVDCAPLRAAVASRKAGAQACSFQIGECKQSVDDECGCEVSIGSPTSDATTAYKKAVADLAAHPECLVSCKTCPARVTGSCLESPSGIACTP